MADTIDLSGLARVQQGFLRLMNPDATDLMKRWMDIIEEDNRTGILQGLDKDGVPMVPVTYRPKPPTRKITKAAAAQVAKRQRLGQSKGKRAGSRAGFGPFASGLHNNLTSSEYRLLGGPPLAPRDQFSRVISNLKTNYDRLPSGEWYAFGQWDDVVTPKGIHFLHWHFDGAGRLPRRDLRGVRPVGMAKALQALQNWTRLILRQAFGRGAAAA